MSKRNETMVFGLVQWLITVRWFLESITKRLQHLLRKSFIIEFEIRINVRINVHYSYKMKNESRKWSTSKWNSRYQKFFLIQVNWKSNYLSIVMVWKYNHLRMKLQYVYVVKNNPTFICCSCTSCHVISIVQILTFH